MTHHHFRLAAFQPDIAQNLGTMIRTCACLGVPMDIIEPCGFPLSIKALRRSAMDYADIADLTRYDGWEQYQDHRPSGRLILLTTRFDQSVFDFQTLPGDQFLVGRESAGVPEEVHESADRRIGIPMLPETRSLNVAIAAAMVLSEALRQRPSQVPPEVTKSCE